MALRFLARVLTPALLPLVAVSSWLPPGSGAELPAPKGRRIVLPFDYQGVTLDGGRLRAQLDEVREYYLHIPDDALLKGFRLRAGLPAPGVDLGGWYSADTFHIFGQILSGLARLHAASGDPACREKANELLHGWAQCIGPDGFFFYSGKPNAPHYVFDKMVCGLLDVYLYCGNQEALAHLRRITEWAAKNLERSRRFGDTGTEWYTLSENLYRAYLATGDPLYREFAEVWEYTEYWDLYGRHLGLFGRPGREYHAYSHVNTLSGAGAAYLVTGQARYLRVIENAYEFLQANQVFATGGYGPDEHFLPHAALMARLAQTHNTFETQCGSWAAFKLAKYLIAFTGDARYGDWIERLIYNGIGASLPMDPTGHVFYYSDYHLGGAAKRNFGEPWPCCAGTRPQAVADYCDLVYFRDPDTLYVNLYTPSTVRWHRGNSVVTLRQETQFPETPIVHFTLQLEPPAEFGVALRAPDWLAQPISATLNGETIPAPAPARNWVTFRRTWRAGDRLAVTLPAKLSAVPLVPGQKDEMAVAHGPVVLAFRSPTPAHLGKLDLAALDRCLVPNPAEALTYRLDSAPDVLARPFYAFREGEPYFLAISKKLANQIAPQEITFSGPWNVNDQFHFTDAMGAAAECKFDGTGVRWLGFRFDDAGRAQVTIDGQSVGVVDQYGPGRGLPFDWSHRSLPPGPHTIRIQLLPGKDERSKGHFINVAGFEAVKN